MQRRAGGTYYFRKRIPEDVREAFSGKREWVESLGTKDPAEAKRRVRRKAEDFDNKVASARLRADVLGHPADMSAVEAEQLAGKWLAEVLEQDASRRQGPITAMSLADVTLLVHTEASLRDILRAGNIETLQGTVQDFSARNGLSYPPGTPGHRRLSLAIAAAAIKGRHVMVERDKGEWRPAEQLPGANAGLRLSELFEKYQAEQDHPPKTITENKRQVRLFTELHGDMAVEEITKAKAREFKEAVMKMPARLGEADRRKPLPALLMTISPNDPRPKVSRTTVNKALSTLTAILNWGQGQGLFAGPVNPFTGLKIKGAKNAEPTRVPYDAADLKAIFSGPVHTAGSRPEGGAGEAAYWLPLLALFTGARLEELGKAAAADVALEDGHLVLTIGGKVKTAGSRRRVPLHPELERLGFGRYVARMQAASHGRLFPELKPSTHKTQTAMWSRWWGRYARKTIGIKDPKKTFHSFRHAFKDACRRARIPKEVHDAFTGHGGKKSKDVGESYGDGMGTLVEVLAGEMAKVTYPGLDLGHLVSAQRCD